MSEFRIDQIKSQDATRGPDVAGITTFTGTSGIVMPFGNTAYRGGRDRGIIFGDFLVEIFISLVEYNNYDGGDSVMVTFTNGLSIDTLIFTVVCR